MGQVNFKKVDRRSRVIYEKALFRQDNRTLLSESQACPETHVGALIDRLPPNEQCNLPQMRQQIKWKWYNTRKKCTSL